MRVRAAIRNRITLLMVLSKGKNRLAILIIGAVLSILFFQENQILGGIIALLLLHFDRKDLIFCQIVYAENYKIVIFLEYFLVYILFVVGAIFLKDPLLVYAPIFFLIYWIFINLYGTILIKKRNPFKINKFISSANYEWKAAIGKHGIKIILITVVSIFIISFSKIIYLYNIYIFLVLLVIKDFYIPKEPSIFLEFRGDTKKQIIVTTLKMHYKVFSLTIFPVTTVQFIMFYNDILLIYSLGGLLSAYVLILFIIVDKYKKIELDVSPQLTKLKTAFLSCSVLLPVLTIFVGIQSFIWINEIEKNK